MPPGSSYLDYMTQKPGLALHFPSSAEKNLQTSFECFILVMTKSSIPK